MIKKCYELQVLLGSQSDPFTSWLVERGMRTLGLRIKHQSENAAALAQALSDSPYVKMVHHPSLKTHPQHDIAVKEFGNYFGGMLSIELSGDVEKMNKLMRSLNLAHYAMTLGGYRTSLSYPLMSSHYDVPRDECLKMGITEGLLRISCGIEDTDDLVKDFLQAIDKAYK